MAWYDRNDFTDPQRIAAMQQQEALARQQQAQLDDLAARQRNQQAALNSQVQSWQTNQVNRADRSQMQPTRGSSRSGRFFLIIVALCAGYFFVPQYIYLFGNRYPFYFSIVAIVFILTRVVARSRR